MTRTNIKMFFTDTVTFVLHGISVLVCVFCQYGHTVWTFLDKISSLEWYLKQPLPTAAVPKSRAEYDLNAW